ncbi:MAG: hypothetical protein R2705_00440 [Ilumatobacteraceae bacterium]
MIRPAASRHSMATPGRCAASGVRCRGQHRHLVDDRRVRERLHEVPTRGDEVTAAEVVMGDAIMERPTERGGLTALHHLTGEIVVEAGRSRLLDEQVSVEGGPESFGEVDERGVVDRCCRGQIEGRIEQRDVLQRGHRVGGDRGQPLFGREYHRGLARAASVAQAVQQFGRGTDGFDGEGVALGQLGDAPGVVIVEVRLEALHQFPDLVRGERRQLERVGRRLPQDLGQQGGCGRRERGERPDRDDEEDIGGQTVADDASDRPNVGLRGPVQVVEHQVHRPRTAETAQGREDPAGHRGGGVSVRQGCGTRRIVVVGEVGERLRAARAAPHHPLGPPELGAERRGEGGLADPGFADGDHDLSGRAGPKGRLAQAREFVLPTDEVDGVTGERVGHLGRRARPGGRDRMGGRQWLEAGELAVELGDVVTGVFVEHHATGVL